MSHSNQTFFRADSKKADKDKVLQTLALESEKRVKLPQYFNISEGIDKFFPINDRLVVAEMRPYYYPTIFDMQTQQIIAEYRDQNKALAFLPLDDQNILIMTDSAFKKWNFTTNTIETIATLQIETRSRNKGHDAPGPAICLLRNGLLACIRPIPLGRWESTNEFSLWDLQNKTCIFKIDDMYGSHRGGWHLAQFPDSDDILITSRGDNYTAHYDTFTIFEIASLQFKNYDCYIDSNFTIDHKEHPIPLPNKKFAVTGNGCMHFFDMSGAYFSAKHNPMILKTSIVKHCEKDGSTRDIPIFKAVGPEDIVDHQRQRDSNKTIQDQKDLKDQERKNQEPKVYVKSILLLPEGTLAALCVEYRDDYKIQKNLLRFYDPETGNETRNAIELLDSENQRNNFFQLTLNPQNLNLMHLQVTYSAEDADTIVDIDIGFSKYLWNTLSTLLLSETTPIKGIKGIVLDYLDLKSTNISNLDILQRFLNDAVHHAKGDDGLIKKLKDTAELAGQLSSEQLAVTKVNEDVGELLLFAFTKKKPSQIDPDDLLRIKASVRPRTIPEYDKLTDQMKAILLSCFHEDPKDRPTYSEVNQALIAIFYMNTKQLEEPRQAQEAPKGKP